MSREQTWPDYLNHEKWNILKDSAAEEETIEAIYKILHQKPYATIPEHKIASHYPIP